MVGGGRWARVLAGVLLDLTPSSTRLDIHAPGHAAAPPDWVDVRSAQRVEIHDVDPDAGVLTGADAVIVVNAPRDHARIATQALRAGIPTLVEKPLALSEDHARELVALADERGVFLGVSRVFLFARYVETFARQVAACGALTEARLVWTDPQVEIRHGAAKRYDPSVPVSTDVLPHVLPILRAVLGEPAGLTGSPALRPSESEFSDLSLTRGGMQTDLRLQVGRVPVFVTLARHANVRGRVIEVQTATERLVLDFSAEPGSIIAAGKESNGDPEWDAQPRPVARMLGSFLACAAGAAPDDRLAAASAVDECRIADRALQTYHVRQSEWLATRIGDPLDEEIRYAIVERLATSGHAPPRGEYEPLVARVWADMTRTGVAPVLDALRDPTTLLKPADKAIRAAMP